MLQSSPNATAGLLTICRVDTLRSQNATFLLPIYTESNCSHQQNNYLDDFKGLVAENLHLSAQTMLKFIRMIYILKYNSIKSKSSSRKIASLKGQKQSACSQELRVEIQLSRPLNWIA